MAESISLRPDESDTTKWPKNGPLRGQNRMGFLAGDEILNGSVQLLSDSGWGAGSLSLPTGS
jgi:hypothetical protein